MTAKLLSGASTNIFGLNTSNNLLIGGVTQNINSIIFEISQTAAMTLSGTGLVLNAGDLSINGKILGLTPNAGTTGGVQIAGNATTGNAYLQFIDSTFTNQWGFMKMTSAGTLTLSGDMRAGNDSNFGLSFSAGVQPYLSFDIGDSFSYIRASNAFQWVVGGSSLMQLDSAGKLTVGDANFGAVFNGGTQPFITFDSGDYLQYTRANNTLTFNVAGSAVVTMSAAGGGTLSVGDGNNAWGINGGMPTLQFDVGDYLQYDRAANKFNFFVGGTKVASIDSSGNMKLLGTLTQNTTP
jgi:phage baseplate assembly protein gpV